MTTVFVFAEVVPLEPPRWVGLALTDKGKWIAGAVSGRNKVTVLERCAEMARRKARDMISGEATIEITEWNDPRVLDAEAKAFATMP